MQRTKDASEVLIFLIDYIEISLNELTLDENEFACGEAYAYVECLELMQKFWEDANAYGLNGNLEEKFKIK